MRVDPAAKFAEFEIHGAIQRISTRDGRVDVQAPAAEPVAQSTIDQIKRRLTVLGDKLTERQIEEMAKVTAGTEERIRTKILNDPNMSQQEKEKALGEIAQKRILVIGPKGVSEAEAHAAGIDEEQRKNLNDMNELGKRLFEKAN